MQANQLVFIPFNTALIVVRNINTIIIIHFSTTIIKKSIETRLKKEVAFIIILHFSFKSPYFHIQVFKMESDKLNQRSVLLVHLCCSCTAEIFLLN